jgi:UDP-N-acetylmuramate--alanine ligase
MASAAKIAAHVDRTARPGRDGRIVVPLSAARSDRCPGSHPCKIRNVNVNRPAADPSQPWAGRRLHFVGIGGAGMSGLALVARQLGAMVSGSDRAESSYARTLRAEGIEPQIGHAPENVADGCELVVSSAIPPENPERARGRELGVRELHRADLLAELTALRRCIAVTGTHGKTTTAAMVVHVLRACAMDPAYVVGAELRSTRRGAAWGTGEWIVVEADESDRSLLGLHPDIAVLTNAELDHHATYDSREELEQTFAAFLARAPQAVVWDRQELLRLREGRVVAYDAPEPVLDPAGSHFGWRGHEVRVSVPGAHNAVNAAGALEACVLAGADPATAAGALADFTGAARRFEPLGATSGGAQVYDDYAHHPTEVGATLEAARTLRPGRLTAVFQPHLYSRTRAFAADFGRALAVADRVVVLDVYPARERAEDFPGVDGRLIAAAAADAAEGRPVAWLPGFPEAERHLRATLRPGELCLCMGAGDVDELARRLVA